MLDSHWNKDLHFYVMGKNIAWQQEQQELSRLRSEIGSLTKKNAGNPGKRLIIPRKDIDEMMSATEQAISIEETMKILDAQPPGASGVGGTVDGVGAW